MYIVAPSPAYNPEYIAEVMRWAEDVVNVPAWQHLVFTNRKDLIYGDYLIDRQTSMAQPTSWARSSSLEATPSRLGKR